MASQSKATKYPIWDEIEVTKPVFESWQLTVNLLAKIGNIPTALIMRSHAHEIEVLVSSQSVDHVYGQGEVMPLNTGLYCETVMDTQRSLLVPNALNDPNWDHNPDIELGMISYYGLPLTWSDGKIFGTICILDKQENHFSPEILELMESSRDSIQCNLKSIYETRLAERCKHLGEIALHRSKENIKTLDSAMAGILNIDAWGCLIDINSGAEAIFGWKKEEVLGRPAADLLVSGQHRQTLHDALACFTQTRQSPFMNRRLESTARRRDGSEFPVELTITHIQRGTEDIFIAFIRDVTEDQLLQQRLRIAATAFESDQGMMVTDANSVILSTNRAFTEITGYSAEEVLGKKPSLLNSGRHSASFYSAIWDTVERAGSWHGEIWNRRKNGEIYPEWLTLSEVREGADHATHYVGIFSDLSLRKQTEERINTLAFYDPLTHLPNRRLLLDRLKQAVFGSNRSARHGALVFLDLDNFKNLNDTLGHDMGDLLLQQVALRLSACVRERDTVARLGGDEFVMMIEDLSESAPEAATQVEVLAVKVLKALNEPYRLDNHAYHGTPSIGVTLFVNHEGSTDDLLKRADLAMYQAKAAGRNTVRFFDPAMQLAVNARVALEADLREALVQNQFLLYYQAQVDDQAHVHGVEVLLRWQHPRRGLVSPQEFIPVTEETGLILPLGLWVLETACAQIKRWADEPGMSHLTVAVNVSFKQLHDNDFVNQVLHVLDKTGANPRRLKLELTESLLARDVEGVIAKMSALKAKGVSFSLDDFGTGYSSLNNLKRLPFDQLKIDQGFVRNILSDANDAAIAKMVVSLAVSMGLGVIAEGVELKAQSDFLASEGCHSYQGYLYAHPVPLADFEHFVTKSQLAPETLDPSEGSSDLGFGKTLGRFCDVASNFSHGIRESALSA